MLKMPSPDSVDENRLSAVFVVYGSRNSAVFGTNAVSGKVAYFPIIDTFRKTH